MDARWNWSAFMVVKSRLYVHELPSTSTTKWRRRPRVTDTAEDWEPIECASRKAYGCGKHGQKLVEGLTLYVRRLVKCPVLTSAHIEHLDLTSALSIRLSSEAVQSIYEELGATVGELEVKEFVKIAKQHLLVILVHFRLLYQAMLLTCYLVYDSTDRSLFMIPCLPSHLQATYTLTPIPVETAEGHALAIIANKCRRFDQEGLCLCTPATRSDSASDGSNTWKMIVQRFPKLAEPFVVDEMFSLGHMVFWADLSQGLVYCNLSNQGSVDFIKLPHGYEIKYFSKEYVQTGSAPEPRKMTRTIGCFGGSIKFICINRHGGHPGGETVNVWTLNLTDRLWKREKGFPCRWEELGKHVLGYMKVKFWDVEPQYPTLMHDGALCLLLPWRKMGRHPQNASYICNFDMHSKSPLWLGVVRDYCCSSPLILPYNFFPKSYDHPGGSCQAS